MSALNELVHRLRLGLATEIVPNGNGDHRAFRPNPAEYYELPKAAWGKGLMRAPEALTLPACRMIVGEYETYAVEHIARRPGGDLDVVVSATPHDHRARTYLAFRRCEGQWRPLAGRDRDLATAVHRAQHEQRFAGWDSLELAAVLNTVEVTA
ncbi:hypothetical protein ACGF0J_21680 [Nonomuraea sp. NPDC047897]|uniref:hypothetical protein n=1 Tax=Nonomuraea sp. NPDC047897 TaxID=3364346 RepID=UPI0037129203